MSRWLRESVARNRTLTLFGLVMWAACLPAALAWGLDDRELRGVNVWVKPMKFMASIGLFALSTAWFMGLLPAAERQRWAVRSVTGLIVVFGGAEIVYITLQAGLGQASHYNFSSPLHIALYSAMGFGAVAMTASQPLLAWQILRHGRPDAAPAWRLAVLLGLVLTFVLGTAAGGLLGSMQPPAGAGLPLVGWHLAGGDLRPAHFLGLHAQQFLPLAGLAVAAWTWRRARVALVLFTLLYTAAWAWALQRGLQGAVLTVPQPAG